MEVVSGVASIVNLVQAAGALAKTAWDVYQRLHDAPIELQGLSDRLLLVHDELERIRDGSDDGHASLLTPDTQAQFEAALIDAREGLDDLTAIASKLPDSSSIRSRARWAFKDRKEAGKVLARLQRTRKRLDFLAREVTLYAVFLSHRHPSKAIIC